MTIMMTHIEMKAAFERIAGKDGDMISRLVKILRSSDRTVRAAYEKGEFGPRFERSVRDEIAHLDHQQDMRQLADHKRMRSALEELAGGTGRGMIKHVAGILGRSERVISDAYGRGIISKDLAEIVDIHLERARRRAAETSVFGRAGVWLTSQPSDRQDDPRIIDETTITHAAAPLFLFQMLAVRGDDGRIRHEEAVHWVAEPSSDARRAALLSEARRRAKDELEGRAEAVAVIEAREAVEAAARRRSALDDDELAGLSHVELLVEASGVDIDASVDEIDHAIHEKEAELRSGLGGRFAGATRVAEELGALRLIRKIAAIAVSDEYRAPAAAYITARAYGDLPLARRGTARRAS